jgi:hypothetical protein
MKSEHSFETHAIHYYIVRISTSFGIVKSTIKGWLGEWVSGGGVECVGGVVVGGYDSKFIDIPDFGKII